MTASLATIRAIRRDLLSWYDRHRRDLPWRRRAGDPYAQWVAEIMLQQTRVETVVPYYERFMARFPTVHHLAQADHQTLLKHWEGLGYYRRALHLHTAAKIVSQTGGTLPPTAERFRELPGIGEYTAAAISSIAFGEPLAAVDGNVSRVTARIVGIRGDNRALAWRSQTKQAAGTLLETRRPGDFNQAMMDLGSGICTPRTPTCAACPLRRHCEAHRLGLTESIPGRIIKAASKPQTLVAVAFVRDGRVLMRRRSRGGLWSGLWELPCIEARPRGTIAKALADLAAPLVPELASREFEVTSKANARAVVVRHQLTHRDLTFRAYVCRCPVRPNAVNGRSKARSANVPPIPPDYRWVTESQVAALPISTAHRKILTSLAASPGIF